MINVSAFIRERSNSTKRSVDGLEQLSPYSTSMGPLHGAVLVLSLSSGGTGGCAPTSAFLRAHGLAGADGQGAHDAGLTDPPLRVAEGDNNGRVRNLRTGELWGPKINVVLSAAGQAKCAQGYVRRSKPAHLRVAYPEEVGAKLGKK